MINVKIGTKANFGASQKYEPSAAFCKKGRPNQEASFTAEKSISLYAGKKHPIIRVNKYPPTKPIKIEIVLKNPFKKIVAIIAIAKVTIAIEK